MKRRPKSAPRARQFLAAEIIDACLTTIHRCFYLEDKHGLFFRDRETLLKMVVLWPAKWFNNRGVSLPGDRYQDIVCSVVRDASAHHTAKIQYPPAFLGKSLQAHFRIHGEEYYEEGKAARNLAESAIASLQATAKAAPDPIRVMAQTRDILTTKKPAKKRAEKPAQLNLF